MSQKGPSKSLASKETNNIQSNHKNEQYAANSSITNPPIIGITAFAEEISTLKKFFAHVPAQTGIAFVVSHPEPHHEHRLIESLQSDTRLQVYQAANEMKIKPDCVYIPPPGFDLTVRDGAIRLTQRSYLSDDSFSFPVGIALNETGAVDTLELGPVNTI